MGQSQQYRDNVVSKIKQHNNLNSKIVDSKHEKVDMMVREMWRAIHSMRATFAHGGRQKQMMAEGEPGSIYEYSECQKIEDKINETNMERIRLPLISNKCIVKSGGEIN
jgi:hypothetical protein